MDDTLFAVSARPTTPPNLHLAMSRLGSSPDPDMLTTVPPDVGPLDGIKAPRRGHSVEPALRNPTDDASMAGLRIADALCAGGPPLLTKMLTFPSS